MSDYEDCERCGWRGPIGFHPTPEACIKTLVDANMKGNAEEFRLSVENHRMRDALERIRQWDMLDVVSDGVWLRELIRDAMMATDDRSKER